MHAMRDAKERCERGQERPTFAWQRLQCSYAMQAARICSSAPPNAAVETCAPAFEGWPCYTGHPLLSVMKNGQRRAVVALFGSRKGH